MGVLYVLYDRWITPGAYASQRYTHRITKHFGLGAHFDWEYHAFAPDCPLLGGLSLMGYL